MSSNSAKILTIIPARMASTRLPGKPLADMAGTPMIIRVWQQAIKADLGPVIVACAESEIKSAVESVGGIAVLTDPDLPSGSDRVQAAAEIYDPEGGFEIILNLQGDMPLIDPDILLQTVNILQEQPKADIATAVTATQNRDEMNSPHVVKAVLSEEGRALYFSRSPIPYGAASMFHHVGLYAYRRAALNKFCSLPPSSLELTERLEQLRALENDMIIYAAEIDHAPAGIDTPEDLEKAVDVIRGS